MKKIKFVIKKVIVKDSIRIRYLKKKKRIKNAWFNASRKKQLILKNKKILKKKFRYRIARLKLTNDSKISFFKKAYFMLLNFNWNYCNLFYMYEYCRLRIFYDKNIKTEEHLPQQLFLLEDSLKISGFFINKEERVANSFQSQKLNFYTNYLIWKYKQKLNLEENYEKFLEKIVETSFDKIRFSNFRLNTVLNYNQNKYLSYLFFENLNKIQIIVSKLVWFISMIIIYILIISKIIIPWLLNLRMNIINYINNIIITYKDKLLFLKDRVYEIKSVPDLNTEIIWLTSNHISILTEKYFYNNIMLNIGIFYDVINILIIQKLPKGFINAVLNTDFSIKLLDILLG
uniref:Uncharacterized protein orf343 n=1 Tax=Heterostelium pallidum TaxID=13642 RepID=Q5ILJ0_HETPA|nr:hypothetical protein PopaoMp34 [Heterostelium pallidum]AAU00620.1 unknown [Heterostelium pallidum]